MARLPQPGGDDGNWGTILNDYLAQVHNADGTLKNGSVTSAALAPNAVNSTALANGAIIAASLNAGTGTDGQVLIRDSAAGGGFKWGAAGASSPTNLTATPVAGAVTIASSTGSSATLAGATASAAGVMAAADKSKLDGITAGATANSTDAQLRDRATHTGTQAIATVTNLQTTLDGKVAASVATAKGDLLAATGAAAFARIGVGANGQVLTADSATATGIKWATPAAGGGGGYTFTFKSVNTATATAANADCLIVDTSSTGVTITLPAPVANGIVRVKRISASGNGLQVAAPGGSYIDGPGVGTDTLNNQWDSRDYWSDGTNWYR